MEATGSKADGARGRGRSWLTWLLGGGSALMGCAAAFNNALLILGVRGYLGDARPFQDLTATWSAVTWVSGPATAACAIAAGVLLLLLRVRAVAAFGLYLLLAGALTVHHALTTDWLATYGPLGLASALVGYAFFFACWAHARTLRAHGRLR